MTVGQSERLLDFEVVRLGDYPKGAPVEQYEDGILRLYESVLPPQEDTPVIDESTGLHRLDSQRLRYLADKGICLVAVGTTEENDGKLLGFVALETNRSTHRSVRLAKWLLRHPVRPPIINSLVVAPEHRQEGIATVLLGELATKALSQALHPPLISVNEQNTEALLFLRHSFKNYDVNEGQLAEGMVTFTTINWKRIKVDSIRWAQRHEVKTVKKES